MLAGWLVAAGAAAQTPDPGNLTARAAVAMALEHNRDLQRAQQETRRAEYRITEARAGALPQLNGSWSFDRTLKPNVFVISFPDSNGVVRKSRLKMGTDYSSSLGAQLVQPLYVGGKVGTALEAARIYRTSAARTEELVRQNVVLETLQAFNGALLARQLAQIARASLAQAERHLANVEVRQRAGAATDYDLLRARVNAANLQPRLIEAENNVRVSLLHLKQAMGVDPEAPAGVEGTLAAPDTTVLQQAQSAVALQRRPDVAVSRLTIELQRKAVRIARGDYLPTLSASSTLAYNGSFDELGYRGEEWSTFWTAGLSLTVPLFTGFRTSARYQQARVDLRQAQTDFEKTRDAAVIEVQQAVMGFRKALRQIESQGLNVDEAQRAVEIAESLYANGRATQLEVLDAQLALQVARTNMASALHEGTVSDIILRKALGLLEAGANGEE
ncbi:MAG: TolC family protein [Candidatus Latescibacterota bacterium]